MMAFITSDYGTHTGLTLPTGFTEIGRRAYGDNRLAYVVGYKVATGSEPSSYTYTVPTSADSLYSMMSIQNADTSIAPAITNTLTDGSTVAHSAPGVHPIGSNDLMLSTVTLDSSSPANLGAGVTWTPAGGTTELVDQQVENFMSMIITSESLANAGETGRKTHRPNGAASANPGIGFGIGIKGTRDSVASVLPDSTLAGNSWTGGHADIDETGVADAAGLVAGTTDVARSGDFTFQDPVVTKAVDYVQLYVCAHSYTSAVGGVQDSLGIRLTIDGAAQLQETVTPPYSASLAPTSCSVYTFTYYGSWTQAQLANMQVNFTRNMLGTTGGSVKTRSDNIRVEYARLRVLSHDAFVETRPLTNTPTVRDIKSASVNSATSSKTVARPTVQQGDLMIAILGADKGHLHETNLPTGFTEVGWMDGFFDDTSTTTSLARAKVGIKTATASEPTSYTYSVNSTANSRIDVISVAGADTSVQPVVARRMTPKSATTHRAPSVYPPGRADLLLSSIIKAPVGSSGITWTPPAGMTEMSDANVPSGISMTLARQSLSSGEPTGLKEFTQSTGETYSAATFNIAVKGELAVDPHREQSSYRFYDTSGTPLAVQNTATNVPVGTSLRLRQLMRQTQGLTSTTESFKLQAGIKESTCSAATYSDITTIFNTAPSLGVLLADDFTTADSTKWTGYGPSVSINQGRLQLAIDSNFSAVLSSNANYDLTGGEAIMEVVEPPSAGNGSKQLILALRDSNNANNELKIYTSGNLLLSESVVNGTKSSTNITHDPVAHRWWRIREAQGTIYWETSPDAVTWTVRRQLATPIPTITSLKPIISAGYTWSELSSTALIDNFSFGKANTNVDESVIATAVNDPTPLSGDVIPQTLSNTTSFTVRTALQSGQNGLWEYSLKADPSMDGKAYCFRMIKSDGTPLTTYAQYAELSVGSSAPSLDKQLRGGQAVVEGIKHSLTW